MVLCKFFQQGSCRFGSKCHNEHFEVKQFIKTDVESAINGKQWPLSTYGPFKDKPSIPNFIEDQSFEEIRILCYEAKQKNYFEQFHQQFTKEVMEATNKMKALLQMTPEIVDVVINVYEAPSDVSCSGVTAGKGSTNNNNPFSLGNPAATNAGSILAKTSISNTTSNIFGSNTAGGGFGTTYSSGSNIFGGTTTQTSSSLFGNASAFGQQQQQQQQSSIFGQGTNPANSLFVGSITNAQQKPAIFGQQQTQPTIAMGGNLFASSSQIQQQTPTGFGLFSQQTQQPTQQQPSIFGQQVSQPQNSNIFNQTPNLFGQTGQISQPQQPLYAQTAQNMQQPQQQPGLFAQAAQQNVAQTVSTGQGLFAQAVQQSQNVYNQAMQQQQLQTNSNLFQQSQPNAGQQKQQISNQQPHSGLFQQALQTQNSPSVINQSHQFSSTVYSRMEDLTPDEIEAFKADCFLPGKIPFNPPPKEFIN